MCPGYYSSFCGRATPASPPIRLVQWLGKQPPPQPTTSLGTHWGLEQLGPFQENTLPRMHHPVRAAQGKHWACGERSDRRSGWAAGGAGAAGKRVRHQVKYDLHSIHRHFLYKHPSPDRKQGWGNWRVGGPPGPPRGRQMDRKSGEEEVSGEKQWGEGGGKERMLGRRNRPYSPTSR